MTFGGQHSSTEALFNSLYLGANMLDSLIYLIILFYKTHLNCGICRLKSNEVAAVSSQAPKTDVIQAVSEPLSRRVPVGKQLRTVYLGQLS